MRTIWKYPLEFEDTQTLELPAETNILHVAYQEADGRGGGRRICLWAWVSPENALIERTFRIFDTGASTPNDEKLAYIGTVLLDHERSVLHVFEELA
jgi:hypothetical protein